MRQKSIVSVAYGLNALFSGLSRHSMNIDRLVEFVLLDVAHCADGWKEECSAYEVEPEWDFPHMHKMKKRNCERPTISDGGTHGFE